MYTLENVQDDIIIKRSHYADTLDDQIWSTSGYDILRQYMSFRDAYYGIDDIISYTLSYSDIAFVTDDPEAINAIANDYKVLYDYLDKNQVDKLVKRKRQEILSEYVEYNNYYRMILGLPNMLYDPDTGWREDEANYVYLNRQVPGVDDTLPLHKMTYLEKYNLKITGYLDSIIKDNADIPERDYLKYLDKDTDIVKLRDGQPFEIIWSRGNDNDFNKFVDTFGQVRRHFMTTAYNERFTRDYQYYEPLMVVFLIMCTLINIATDEPRKIIDDETLDEREIELTLKSYGVPLFDFSSRYLNAVVRRMNTLTMLKGTNKALTTISEIFNSLSVYKYFLIKQEKEVITDYSDPTKVYDLFYIQAPIEADDPWPYVNEADFIPFDSIASADPLWGYDGNTLEDEILAMDFSYSESKYLGINNSIDITMFTLEMAHWFRYVCERKDKFKNIKFYIDTLDLNVSLFDIMIYMDCILFRKMRLTPDIPDTMASVVFMKSIKNNIDYNKLVAMWQSHFRFTEYKDYINDLKDAPANSTYHTAIDVWQTDMNILIKLNELKKQVTRYEDFQMIDTIIKAFTYGEKIPTLFDGFTNYEDYLTSISPNFFLRLEELDNSGDDRRDRLNNELTEIINELIKKANKIRHGMYIDMMNNAISVYSDQDILNYVEKLIDFYKSYTQDLLSKGIVYILNDINDGIKITEKITFFMEMNEYEVITTALAFDNGELISFLENLAESEEVICNERFFEIHPDTNESVLIGGSWYRY